MREKRERMAKMRFLVFLAAVLLISGNLNKFFILIRSGMTFLSYGYPVYILIAERVIFVDYVVSARKVKSFTVQCNDLTSDGMSHSRVKRSVSIKALKTTHVHVILFCHIIPIRIYTLCVRLF